MIWWHHSVPLSWFHSCLNVFGFQGLICCFNQNVPGTSLNEFIGTSHALSWILAHYCTLKTIIPVSPRKSMWRSKLSTESCIFNNTKGEFIKCFEDEQKNHCQHSQYFTVLQRGQNKLPEIFVLNFLQDNIIFTVHMFDGHHMPTGTLIFTEII